MTLEKWQDGWYVTAAGIEVWVGLFEPPLRDADGQLVVGNACRAAISVARSDDDAWLDVGSVAHFEQDRRHWVKFGPAESEVMVRLRARTEQTAVAEAMPYALGWALRHFQPERRAVP